MIINKCNLCGSKHINLFSKDKNREYFRCDNCQIIFVPENYYINKEEEKKRYELHTNSSNESGYRNFLSRIVKPVVNLLKEDSVGLDFGCGPGPILKDYFLDYNIRLDEYDLFFKKDDYLLNKKWDFIVTTEVVEHLKQPLQEILKLWKIIKKNGLLAIMTNLYNEDIQFKSWYYKGDPTHITFFSKETFNWLANKIGATVEFIDKDIIILKKDYYINEKENK